MTQALPIPSSRTERAHKQGAIRQLHLLVGPPLGLRSEGPVESGPESREPLMQDAEEEDPG
jgi:hypothetical protein